MATKHDNTDYPFGETRGARGDGTNDGASGGVAAEDGAGPVFTPDTGRDARGSGSHQSGEGGSGNESGASGSEQPKDDACPGA
jgi:hypothetical protein